MYINKKGTEVPNGGSSRTRGTDSYRCKGKHYFLNNNQNMKKVIIFFKNRLFNIRKKNAISHTRRSCGTWNTSSMYILHL